MTKKNKRGHYCKGCASNRPNEKFTAKGRNNIYVRIVGIQGLKK